MKSLRTLGLIARRDFRERVTSRAFQLSTAVVVLVVVGLIVAPRFFDETPAWTVGVVDEADQSLAAAIEAAAADPETTVDVIAVAPGDVESALLDGGADIVVDDGELVTMPGTDPALEAALTAVIGAQHFAEAAAEVGLDPTQTEQLIEATSVDIREIEQEEDESEAVATAFLASILLFVAIATYGQWILAGVVEEKANRVVEVVLGAVRPHQLLTGKVAGIGALGVLQLAVVGVAAVIAGNIGGSLELPTGLGSVAGIVLMWFVLGYAFYATAYAASGSLVSRVEEAQNAAFPLTMVLMIGYFTAAFSFGGDNPVLRVMSLLPPFAPVTMPVRQAAGVAAPWEVALSVTGMIVSTWLLIRVAGRIYAGGLLQGGRRTKVRQAWSSADS